MSGDRLSSKDLSGDLATGVRRNILSLANSKRLLGIRYSDLLLGAPSLETGIAASSMAQDEWGHARLLYAMLKDLGMDPVSVEHDRETGEYASMEALDRPFPDWAAVVAGMVLVDGGLTVLLRGFAEGAYEPAAGRVPKMVVEEAFHASMGAAWFRRLAEGAEEGRTLLTEATRSMLPGILQIMDPPDVLRSTLADARVLPPGATLKDTFLGEVGDLLDLVGVDPAGGEAAAWDPERGRGAGAPEEEAVERARGDRNRELFVE
jgi:1,2-phenylacetyl-CoA epoxidase catalytic subunit